MEVEALGHRRGSPQFLPACRRRREPQASGAMPARRLAGLCLQRSVQLGAIAHQARQVAAAAQLPDQPRRVPRGAVRQLQPLQQHDVAHAALGEMVGDAAADDPAADDDDARLGGQGRWVHAGPCKLNASGNQSDSRTEGNGTHSQLSFSAVVRRRAKRIVFYASRPFSKRLAVWSVYARDAARPEPSRGDSVHAATIVIPACILPENLVLMRRKTCGGT